jgi:hypothetical protein
MSNAVNLTVHEGQPWTITFRAHEADGSTIMTLPSGSVVDFRISGVDGPLLDKTIGDGIVITSEAQGTAEIEISVNDQVAAELSVGQALSYEIRVVKNGVESIQAEGVLSLEASLFSTLSPSTSNPLMAAFRSRFPEITDSDQAVNFALEDAALVVAENTAIAANRVQLATLFLAAHYMQLAKNASTSYASGSTDVRAVRVEDRMVSFAQGSSRSSKVGFEQTLYGQRYLALIGGVVGTAWLLRA